MRPNHGDGFCPWSSRVAIARDLLVICTVSIAYEWLFLRKGINLVDEGWPLYAAMQLDSGGTLYSDVFFVFPPGHALCAWLAYALDPPGVLLSRVFYSAFVVALCAVTYLLGRRLMPGGFALLACLMLAVCSPTSHFQHSLFGYRYLMWSVLALLCFAHRFRHGDARWMGAAGIFAGLQLAFRQDPAFAVVCGIAVGVLTAHRNWRRWLGDGLWFGAGALAVLGPVLGWLLLGAGPEALWQEVVVRPIAMTVLQKMPVPPLFLPLQWNRELIAHAFTSLLFRLVPLVYLVYAVALFAQWVKSLRTGNRFDGALLLSVVVWGAVYFTRAFGRSDEPHLASALPPFFPVVAHLLSLGFRQERGQRWGGERRRVVAAFSAGALLLAAWSFLGDSDRVLRPPYIPTRPLIALAGEVMIYPFDRLDLLVRGITDLSSPDDRVLILGPHSLLNVMSGRLGPGRADVIMPGTFLDDSEEQRFMQHLEADPPALVVRPMGQFDFMEERSVERTAPRVVAWVEANYELSRKQAGTHFLVPRGGAGQ